MADTTTLKKLIGIFNKYIADPTATSFSEYCSSHSYTAINEKGTSNLNAYLINNSTDIEDSDHINFDVDFNIAMIKHKLEEFIGFIYTHYDQINTNFRELNITLRDIIKYLNEKNQHLSFSDEEADKIINKFHTSVEVGDITVPKTKRKTLWAAKKIGIPTAITAGVCGVISGIIAASGAVVGALPFLTDSILLNVATMATGGVLFGAVLTPLVIVAKNAIVRTYFKNKYGRNSNSLKELLSKDNIRTKEDLKDLNLDIIKLMDLIKNTEDKLIQYKTEKVNPFKKAWRTVKSYFMRKNNRNRMHELVAFTKVLESKADSAETKTEYDKYKLLYSYIDEFWGNNIVNNYSEARNKNKTKKAKVQNLDIIAKADLSKKEKKHKSLLISKAKNLVQRAILRSMLTGKAGSVLGHKFDRFGGSGTTDGEVINLPRYWNAPNLPAPRGSRELQGPTNDDITLPAQTGETASTATENDEELPLLRLAEENKGGKGTPSDKRADNIALMRMEEIMLKMMSDNDLDEISKKYGYTIEILNHLKEALSTKQKRGRPLAKCLRTYSKLGDDPEKLYETIANLAKANAVDAMVKSAGIE